MRRFRSRSIVLVLPALLAAGFALATAGPAAAAVVDKGVLAPDMAATAAISVAGQDQQWTFTGTQDVASTIDVTASQWKIGTGTGNAQLEVFTPSNVLFVVCPLAQAATYCEFTPNVTGAWKLRIDPVGNATGSSTFVFAQIQNKGPLTSGVAATTTIARKGQNARWTFAGTKNLPAVFNITAASWGTAGAARLYFYAPGSTALFSWCNVNTLTQCPLYPNVTGTWTVTVDPLSASTGSLTMVYAQDQALAPLTLNKAVPVTISTAYQNAQATFAATADTHLSLDVPVTDWGTGYATLNIYMPDGTLYYQCPLAKTATFCDFTPNLTDTNWKVGIDPAGTATGTATINLVADQNLGSMTIGKQVMATLGARGQNAQFTLPATATTESATLHLTGSTYSAARLYLFAPGDTTLYDFCDVHVGTTDCTFYPSFAGDWKVTLDPLDAAIGTTTIKRIN